MLELYPFTLLAGKRGGGRRKLPACEAMADGPGDTQGERALSALGAHERERATSRFERLEKLGSGGMAVVYRAIDRKLGREVAIKELLSEYRVQPEGLVRFRREAEAVARLSHPNVVTFFDAVEGEEGTFLVMELVKGEPLNRVLESRRFELRGLVGILEKVARGVHHAHEQGVVHRDLKPSNVLVTAEGEPKVADFGVAQLAGELTTLTRSGALVGTPLYMAPEQARGQVKEIGPRTDVYALGVMLYEILTGRVPHAGDSVAEIVNRITSEDPEAPRRVRPGVPVDLETIALHAIQKEPGRRYPSARDFADDLAHFLAGEPISARPPGTFARLVRRVKRHKTAAAAAATLLLAVLVAGAYFGIAASRFNARVASLLGRAQAESDPGRAASLYDEVRALIPGHPEAERLAVSKRLEAEQRTKSLEAAAFVASGNALGVEAALAKAELARARRELSELREKIPAGDPPEKKKPLWAAEARVESLSREVAVKETSTLVAYASALGSDPRCKAALAALASAHYRALEEAEEANDLARADSERKLFLLYDQEGKGARLAEPGTLSLDTRPSGAAVHVFRYETAPDTRLFPRAHDGSEPPAPGQTFSLELSEKNLLGVAPIVSARLAAGSYLLVLSKEGYRDVRYPVLVERGRAHAASVNLYTEAEIGADFIYVPAGPFIVGGDEKAVKPRELDRHAETGDFFLARHEVTMKEYVQFLSAKLAEGSETVLKQFPRRAPTSGYYWRPAAGAKKTRLPEGLEPKWPVFGIGWEDAQAYCDWKCEKEPGVYRMPTTLEWEKAARGADGRLFPWGNFLEWSFASTTFTHENGPGNVERFPADESPYGVLDMGGSVMEWCSDSLTDVLGHRRAKGGSWDHSVEYVFHAATNSTFHPTMANGMLGFRLAKNPPQKK
jgi:formylglycine-generating enzyme required for sulfatase activity/tRNA A-37 threonylcarbamoyl transferase component Bud32